MIDEQKLSILLSELSRPFHPLDIEWRIGSAWERNGNIFGRCFAYVTNRAVMARLDEVVGPHNWQTEIKQLTAVSAGKGGPKEGFLASIGIHCPDGWVWKTDGADNTDFEAIKGGISGAVKRSAVSWGIGRYLYYLPTGVITIHDNGIFYEQNERLNKKFNWSPPELPVSALPSSELGLANMQAYISKNYVVAEHGDIKVTTLNDAEISLAALFYSMRTNPTDYYLTLFAYEGLKAILERE